MDSLKWTSCYSLRSPRVSCTIVGRCQPAGQPVTFCLRVVDVDGTRHTVHRRFSSFVSLAKALEREYGLCPTLPPKSLVRKFLDRGFLDRREDGLATFLAAVLEEGPGVTSSALQRFLELRPRSPTSSFQAPLGRLPSITELDERGARRRLLSIRHFSLGVMSGGGGQRAWRRTLGINSAEVMRLLKAMKAKAKLCMDVLLFDEGQENGSLRAS